MTTSFSTKQRSQMLQSRPMVAPARTLTHAQMRVPSPTRGDATSAVGWIVDMEREARLTESEVVRSSLPVELDGAREPLPEADARLPPGQPADRRDVRDEVARLLRLPLRREVGEDDPGPGYEVAQGLRHLEEGGRAIVPDVQHLADRRGLDRRGDERFHAVVH